MASQRPPASRRVAVSLCLALGLLMTVVSLIAMAADRLGSDGIAAHVRELYGPQGQDPDPDVLWAYLATLFVVGALCWAVALWATLRRARWACGWSTAAFVLGGSALVFTGVVTEHGSAIFPLGWRLACFAQAGLGAVAVLVAWLPLNDRVVD